MPVVLSLAGTVTSVRQVVPLENMLLVDNGVTFMKYLMYFAMDFKTESR